VKESATTGKAGGLTVAAPQGGLIATGYDTTFVFCRLSGESRKPVPFFLDPGPRRDDTLFKKSFPELSNFVGPPAKPGVYLKEIIPESTRI
jgi:hypothetical protein